MPWRRLSALAAALVLAGTFAADAIAQRGDRDRDGRREWVLLGERTVGFRVDRDVFEIRQSEDWYRDRGFRRLHLVAERNDIHLMSVRLVYMNGFDEDYPIDRFLREGQDHEIDLRGERKYLRRVEMIYRSRANFEGRAVMKLYGEPARFAPRPDAPPDAGADWVSLGCQRVSFLGVDRDTVHVGRREGRFKSIRLHVRGADVRMLDLTVVYANGSPDSIPVRAVIREGERTRPLKLEGWQRAIDRVEMTYATIPNFKGQATVCVEGLQ